MNSRDSIVFRINLAKGFLKEAEQDYPLERWRSCVDNSQLAVENAAKAILSLFGIPSRTHEPGKIISKLIHSGQIKDDIARKIKDILPDILALGEDEHFMTDYGDEATMTLPWDLYDSNAAALALDTARRITAIAVELTGSDRLSAHA